MSNTENPQPAEHLAPIEYQPSRIDQIHGAIGRAAVLLHGVEQVPEYPPSDGSLHDLMKLYEGTEDLTLLDPESPAAQHVLSHFHNSPKLASPMFIPNILGAKGANALAIEAQPDSPVHLPVRNFVSAAGLQDWNNGRGGPKGDAYGASSRQKIREYARKGEPMPPIGFVKALVQPDGRVLYAATQDGSHRVAAAHLRGDTTI